MHIIVYYITLTKILVVTGILGNGWIEHDDAVGSVLACRDPKQPKPMLAETEEKKTF